MLHFVCLLGVSDDQNGRTCDVQDDPGSGCRSMAQELLPKLLPPLLQGLREWTLGLRLGAARTLRSLLLLAGTASAAHLPTLLPALRFAAGELIWLVHLHKNSPPSYCPRESPSRRPACPRKALVGAGFHEIPNVGGKMLSLQAKRLVSHWHFAASNLLAAFSCLTWPGIWIMPSHCCPECSPPHALGGSHPTQACPGCPYKVQGADPLQP